MVTEVLSGEDIRYLAQQPDAEVGVMLGQMTTLLQNITDLQQDTDDKVAKLESQGWFKRMVNTLFGRNKATKQEIQKNNDKVVTYISQSVAQLYQMNMINERIICSLGNRMNEVYMQVTSMYQEQLNMKAQMSQIMALQQQTLEAMGAFVSRLNEKIESVDNFHMLISEIQNGMYCDPSWLYNLCSILSQLDKRQMDDNRKMALLRSTMERAGVITQEEFSVSGCLQEIVALPTEKIGLIYMELCNFRQSFPANLFADMIENYHFLSKMERMSKKKELIIQRVMDAYELDPDAAFSVADIADSSFENKQACLVALANVPQIVIEYDQGLVDRLMENKDYNAALDIIRPAAERGNAEAQNVLGNCYHKGKGVSKDYAKAVEWYRKAAEQGYAMAQNSLGGCYYDGKGVAQDYTKAMEWFRKAAEQGYARAQFNLGIMYNFGNGVIQNKAKAFEWYSKAAEQEYANAQYNLGVMYETGDGITQDKAKAVEWFRKAAEQGFVHAQYNLGAMYENGDGVSQDYAKAVEWYRKAAKNGSEQAKENLRILGYSV